jgi:GTP cyclohydrolase I
LKRLVSLCWACGNAQLQERLTAQIADTLYRDLGSQGSFVVVEAEQLCN